MTNIFIAPKIKVGFQTRSDTFNNQLAYIIYYDQKGKLHKEKSWNSWRDQKIEPQEFDNIPIEGFTINKDIKRYSGEWFSSNRTMIRIHDPRGFEFEVTTENLIGILMHTDCLKRGLIGKFVYAWAGAELVLLPINSEEYQHSVKYTNGLSKNVSIKDLVPGISYKTKKRDDVIYMGKLKIYYHDDPNYPSSDDKLLIRREEKAHIFTSNDGKSFFKKSSAEFLSEKNTDHPISNFASLMDKYNNKIYANKIIKYECRPAVFDSNLNETISTSYWKVLNRRIYFYKYDENTIGELHVDITRTNDISNIKYSCAKGQNILFNLNTGTFIPGRTPYQHRYDHNTGLSLDMINLVPLFDMYITFENGNEHKINYFNELTNIS